MNNETVVYLQGNTLMSTENIAMGPQTPKAHQKSVFPSTLHYDFKCNIFIKL